MPASLLPTYCPILRAVLPRATAVQGHSLIRSSVFFVIKSPFFLISENDCRALLGNAIPQRPLSVDIGKTF